MSETPKSEFSEKTKNRNITFLKELQKTEVELDKEIELLKCSKNDYMNNLHEYNDIKDATQSVLGALAALEGVTVTEIHQRYNLPLNEHNG